MAQQVRPEELYRGKTDRSTGQLVKEVTEDMSTLVRKEIELAKQELGRSINARLKGAVILAVVGVIGLFVLVFAFLAIRDGFAEIWPEWAADLATMGVLIVLAAIAGLVAKKKLGTPISTELTKKNLKEDVELVKSFGKR